MNKIKLRFKQLFVVLKFFFCKFLLIFYRKKFDFWLISERGYDARDNGYVFFMFLKKEHPEIKVKYVITKDSFDRKRLENDDVINYGTFRHYFAYIKCPILISTHVQGFSPFMDLFSQLDKRNIVKINGKRVLIDHCVRMAKNGINKPNVKIDKMICSINQEYEALLNNSGYDSKVLLNLGMPRFDNLFNNLNFKTKNQILFMPTWRVKYYRIEKKEFLKSDYYISCMNFLNNRKLIDFLEKNDIEFVFYPHIEMQKFISCFSTKSDKIKICTANEKIVEDLLIESKILITDYSSVFFDFAYLEKPILFYHFDNDENLAMYSRRWFNFEKDALGPIFYDDKSLVDYLTCLTNYKMDNNYLTKAREFFPSKNNDNCEKVFSEIKKLSLE